MEVNLLTHIRKGEQTALKEAFTSYFEILYRQAIQRGLTPERAEEVIEETFLALWKGDGIGDAPSLLVWLQQKVTAAEDTRSPEEAAEHEALLKALHGLSAAEQQLVQQVIFKKQAIGALSKQQNVSFEVFALQMVDVLEKLGNSLGAD
ncbi:MAG: hypothetical protein AAF135_04615 [Bacteroidota bacterium]